jgi:Holliday junction resolvase RusA-like endonuclease
MLDVCFEVPLPPRGKDRPRFAKNGHAFTPAPTRKWEASLAMMAQAQMPSAVIEEPVRVDVLAVLPRPKRLLRKSDPSGLIWAPVKPDADNIVKATLDALKAFWRDDAQVTSTSALKAYAERDGRARMLVRIRSVGEIDYEVLRVFGDRVGVGLCGHCGAPLSVTYYVVGADRVCHGCANKAASAIAGGAR